MLLLLLLFLFQLLLLLLMLLLLLILLLLMTLLLHILHSSVTWRSGVCEGRLSRSQHRARGRRDKGVVQMGMTLGEVGSGMQLWLCC